MLVRCSAGMQRVSKAIHGASLLVICEMTDERLGRRLCVCRTKRALSFQIVVLKKEQASSMAHFLLQLQRSKLRVGISFVPQNRAADNWPI